MLEIGLVYAYSRLPSLDLSLMLVCSKGKLFTRLDWGWLKALLVMIEGRLEDLRVVIYSIV